MPRQIPLRPVFLLILMITLFFTGCEKKDTGTSPEDPPKISPLHVLMPVKDGKITIGGSPLLLDVSHSDHGYMIAETDSSGSKYNIQMNAPDGITHSFFLDPGEEAVIPFTGGNGQYTITAYEQITDNQYAALYYESIDLELENLFYPFLYPNQYVNFSPESEASRLALSMLPEDTDELTVVEKIYCYVTENVTYDEEKARTVEAGYLPDVDETLRTGTGICFDFASLTAAMLRSRDIPCRLVIGYSNEIKHAWIDVYIRSVGWVDQAIEFHGDGWTRMDPTFGSANQNPEDIREYIGDGTNYNVQYTR